LVEVVVFLIAIGLVMLFDVKFETPPLIPGIAWLLGTLGGIGSAIAGLIADSRKEVAGIALLTAIGSFILCGTQMLV
jgi:hypothetical protein